MKSALLSLCCLLALTAFGQTSSLPFDFESAPMTADFVNFDGGTGTVIANPQMTSSNNSSMVAQIVRDGGATFAGSKIVLATPLDFSVNGAIQLQVYTPVEGLLVKIKLEGNGQATEKDQFTSVANQWETLTYDFTGTAADVFNEIVFMFDFGNVGDGSANSTFLFDNVEQFDPTGGLAQMDLPVSFDDPAVFYALIPFEGGEAEIGLDPEDASNNVGIAIKPLTAGSSAGVTISTAAGLATAIPFTESATKMTVDVYSPDAGIPVRLKVEDHTDPTRSVETEAMTTLVNQWESLEFDFSNQAMGTAALNLSFTFDKASIFFNFGTDGPAVGETKTYYFDNLRFGDLASSIEQLEQLGLQYFPNPFQDQIRLELEEPITNIRVFNQTGQVVTSFHPNTTQFDLDLQGFPNGIYLLQLQTAHATGTLRVLKVD